MLLVSHIAVGAAIASTVDNPILAVILSFISHYILNCVPHWDPPIANKSTKNLTILIVDIFLSFVISLFFASVLPSYMSSNIDTLPKLYSFSASPITILLCCIFSILPNLIIFPKVFLKRHIKFSEYVYRFHALMHNKDNSIMGKLVEVASVFVFGLYSFRKLPNSDSSAFLQIILIMIVIIAILAVFEAFTEDNKSPIIK